jgi:hypothetical protein
LLPSGKGLAISVLGSCYGSLLADAIDNGLHSLEFLLRLSRSLERSLEALALSFVVEGRLSGERHPIGNRMQLF